jgi:hypothetical protein
MSGGGLKKPVALIFAIRLGIGKRPTKGVAALRRRAKVKTSEEPIWQDARERGNIIS